MGEVAVGDEQRAARSLRQTGGEEETHLRAVRPERRRQQLGGRRVAGCQQRCGGDCALLHASGLPRADCPGGQPVFSTCSFEKPASGEKISCSARRSASRLSRCAGSGSITITSSKKRSTTGRSSARPAYAAR